MKRNQELIKAIKAHWIMKVKDMLNEQKYFDMCADVNFQVLPEMLSPIHFAVAVQDQEITKFLLSKLAEVNAMTSEGVTPLHMSC